MIKLVILSILFYLLPLHGKAQGEFQFGILPSISLNKRLPKDWSAIFRVDSRQAIFREEFNYDYLLTDISLVFTNRITSNITLGGGYLMRIEDNELKNRFIQQVTFSQRFPTFRLSHRFVADQTFEQTDDPEFRFRYRLASEIPLQGESLDVREFYLRLNNEYLNSFQGGSYDLEIRAIALLGYVLSDNNSFEIGIDHRIDSFIHSQARNRTWLSINFLQSL